KPPGGLPGAAGELQDVAEDEFALAAGVGGADDLLGRAEQPLDDGELLPGALVLDELESEALGHDGQRLQGPALEGRVVVLRLLQGDEVAEGPGHLVALALEIPIGWGGGAEKGGELRGDGRLLGKDASHRTTASEFGCLPGGPAGSSRERHRADGITGPGPPAVTFVFHCTHWRGPGE